MVLILFKEKLIEAGYELQAIKEAFKPDKQQLKEYIEINSEVEVHKMDITTTSNRKSVDGYVCKTFLSVCEENIEKEIDRALYIESKYSNIGTKVSNGDKYINESKYSNLNAYKTLLEYFMQMDKKIEGTDQSIELSIKGIKDLEVKVSLFIKYKVLFIDIFGGKSSPQSDGRILGALNALEQEIRNYFNEVNNETFKPITSCIRKVDTELVCSSINEIKVVYTRENIIKLIEKFTI